MPEFPPLRAGARRVAAPLALLALLAGVALLAGACGPGAPSADRTEESEARVVPDALPGDARSSDGSEADVRGAPAEGVAVDTSPLIDPSEVLADGAADVADAADAADGTSEGATDAPGDGAADTPDDGAARDGAAVDGPDADRIAAGTGADTAHVASDETRGEDAVPDPAEEPPARAVGGDLLPPGAATDRSRPSAIPSPATLRPREPLTVPAGSELELRMDRELTTREARTGEAFHASLADDVVGLGGVVLLPAGARVRGRVVESRPSEGPGDPAVLTLAVEDLVLDGAHIPLHGEVVDVEVERGVRDAGRESAAKVGLGALAGAVLGKLLGGDDRDALKGAAAGAAAGAAVAIATRDGHAVIGEGAVLRVRLDRSLRVERR